METLRLFLAIAIPEPVREELRRLQRDLQPLLPPRLVRWARPEQFHLTLKFLGNVPARDVVALREAARNVSNAARPFRLRAEGVGFFPGKSSPRVFWVEIKNRDGSLLEFQRDLEAAVRPFGEKDGNRFTAHVTLARFQKLPRRAVETVCARATEGRFFGEWEAQEAELIESRLQPAGALHAILETFRMKSE